MTESLGVAVAFSAGLFSFLSPCVLPLFPSYLSFITGMSVDRLAGDVDSATRTRVLLHSIAFIAGFTAVFVSLGASFSAAGQLLLDYRDWIRIAGGSLIVIFGLYIAGVLRIGLFGRTQQLHIQSKPAGFIGSFAVGLTFAIGWTPCVGPILGSILTLASNEHDPPAGHRAPPRLLRRPRRPLPSLLGRPRRLPPLLQALPPLHPHGGARGRSPPRRRRHPRDHQLLRRPQRLGARPHPRLASQALVARVEGRRGQRSRAAQAC